MSDQVRAYNRIDPIEAYKMGCYLRTLAERDQDPATYRLAADKFGQAGFNAAQARCIERAEHYEKTTV